MKLALVSTLVLVAVVTACSSKEGGSSAPPPPPEVDCAGLQECCGSIADESASAECFDLVAAAQQSENGTAMCEEALGARVDSGDCLPQNAGGSGGSSGEGGAGGQAGSGNGGTAGAAGCAPNETQCAKGCFDLDNDVANCGSCGLKCPGILHGQATCVSGKCGHVCDSPYQMCWEQCLDTRTDIDNCGACGKTCPSKSGYDTVCSNGKCGLEEQPCPAGTAKCEEDYCQDLSNDSGNCGACGVRCWDKADAAGVESAQCEASKCIASDSTSCESQQYMCDSESCDELCAKKNLKCDPDRVMPSCSSWQSGPCATFQNWNGTQSCHINIGCSMTPHEAKSSCSWDTQYFSSFECPCTGPLP